MSKLQIQILMVGCTVVTLLSLFYSDVLIAAEDETVAFQPGIDLVSDLIGAHSVQSADLDLDGDLDVISAGRESGRILWHQNDGGAFPQFVTHEIGYLQGVYAIYPADLDGDGDSDILATAVGELNPSMVDAADVDQVRGGGLFWFQNDLRTGGGFTQVKVAPRLLYAVGIHVADMDNDGDLDLLSVERDGNTVAWYENDGARPPKFRPHGITFNALAAVSIHAGDLDGDGDMDVVSAAEDENKIAWYLNDGNHPPTFYEAGFYQPGLPPPDHDYAKAVFAADLNGDGKVDIAYVGEDNSEVGWLENQGGVPPTFVPHVLAQDANHAKSIIAEDLDRDGDLDLLVASSDDNKVAWYENDGAAAPTFTVHVVTTNAVGARAVHAADLDGDGDLDLLSASRVDNRITWYPNRTIHRTAIFNEGTQSVVHVAVGARNVHADDLDGDGDIDMLSVAETELLWHENNGASPPAFTTHLIDNRQISGGRWVTTGDLDNDGDVDVAAASKRTNLITWYENLGGQPPTFATHLVTGDARGVRAVLAADLDDDGDLDLYSASDTDDAISWYENNGARPPSFKRHIVSGVADYARSAYAADLDNDGDLDLMSASQLDNKVAWYENLGGTPLQWREYAPDTGAGGVLHIHADDVDDDGDQDMITALELDNSIRWYENQGGSPPHFFMRFVARNTPAVHAVYSGDADQDGDVDLFAAIEGTNSITWYENTGTQPPEFIEHVIVNNTVVAHGVYAADLDGDGDLDVLSASREDGKVAWYENMGGQYAMTAETHPDNSALLHVVVTSRGRGGDADLEVANLDLQLLNEQGAPLTSEQATTLIEQIDVHRVACCEKNFDASASPLLASFAPVTVDANGRLLLSFVDGDPNTRIAPGTSAAYAVVIKGAANTCQNGVRAFRVVNLVTSRVAQDGDNEQALLAEYMRPGERTALPAEPERPAIVINEFMTSNEGFLADPDEPNEYPDWIELYNTTSSPIPLGGKYLTDDLTVPNKHRIADGLVIQPHGYMVFWADGEPEQGPRHLNFRLGRGGEAIGLYEVTATGLKKLDEYVYEDQVSNLTEGRYPNGGTRWQMLGLPTPGRANMAFVPVGQVFLPVVSRSVACQ
jgi:hypothetical protein